MITLSPAPSVPSTAWTVGASVPLAGIGQDLKVVLSPGNDTTVAPIFLSASPISAGALPAHDLPPSGATLAGVCFSGSPTFIVPDHLTRAAAHIAIGRWAGAVAATVAVTGNVSGAGLALPIPNGWAGGPQSFTTSSATFSDVLTLSITTTSAVEVYAHAVVSYTGANNLVGGMRLVIGSQNGDETVLDGTNSSEGEDVTFQSTGLAAGTYTVRPQARKGGGSASLSITHADLFALAMGAQG